MIEAFKVLIDGRAKYIFCLLEVILIVRHMLSKISNKKYFTVSILKIFYQCSKKSSDDFKYENINTRISFAKLIL